MFPLTHLLMEDLILKNLVTQLLILVQKPFKEDLPWDDWKPYRSIKIDGEELEFSTGFTDLHKVSYEEILKGNGFTLEDVEPTIKLIDGLRQKEVKLDGQTFYI